MDVSTIERLQHWPTLSGEEQGRLRGAVLHYERVQARNLEELWGSQTDGEREEAARPLLWKDMGEEARLKWSALYQVDPKAVWLDKQRGFAQLMSGGLSTKSSLLDRLIMGLPALKFRPPTSFSYPWYSVVESGEQLVSTVRLRGVTSLGSAMRGAGGARSASGRAIESLAINQTVFRIVDANDAGEDLLSRSKALMESPDGKAEVEDWSGGAGGASPRKKMVPVVTRAHSGWSGILEAYGRGPEIQVTHGNWPAWKLRLGRRVGVAEARWARKSIESGPFSGMRDLDPLDLLFANLDARIRDGALDCEEQEQGVTEAEDGPVARIRNVLNGLPARGLPDGRSASVGVFAASGQKQDAEAWQGARLESTCWYISKAEGWNNLSGDEMYMRLD